MFLALSLLSWASRFGDPAGRCGEPPSDVGVRLRSEVACLVAEIGPRPSYSAGSARLLDRLGSDMPARWAVERADDGTVVACLAGQDPRTLLLIAHVDAVHAEVPGASDNLAAVVLLREVSRTLRSPVRTVCLAFPDGEEQGLVGSSALALTLARGRSYADGHLRFATLDMVVSVDLFGRGEPAWNGVGPGWDATRLAWLLRVAPARVPFVNRAISAHRPRWERSDHRAFSQFGIPSAHLMSRAEGGVIWAYHTPADDVEVLEPAGLAVGADLLIGLASAGPVPAASWGGPAIVTPVVGWVLPGRAAGLGALALAVTAGAVAAWRGGGRGISLRPWLALLVGLIAGLIGLVLALAGRVPGGSLADAAVGAAVAFGGAGALMIGRPGAVGPAGWGALAQAGACLALGFELLAAPPLVACAAAWAQRAMPNQAAPWTWPLLAPLALWTSGFLVRPDAVRELVFHGFLPNDTMSVAALYLIGAGPGLAYVAGGPVDGRWRLAAAIVLVLTGVVWVFAAWGTDPSAAPFVPRDVRWP